MPGRHNENFEQVGAQRDVPRMCPFHIFFPNVQGWMANWIVGGEVPKIHRKLFSNQKKNSIDNNFL
jgi:hypothetical protein